MLSATLFGTFVVVLTGVAAAETSLFIPGFDPQAISADIQGVDGQGHTTWLLHQGASSGTLDVFFQGTATLVEGAGEAFLTYVSASFTMGSDCTLAGSLAICPATISGSVVLGTESAIPFPVQVGTVTTTNAASPTSEVGPGVSSSADAQPSSSGQTSSRTSAAPGATQSSNAHIILPFSSGLVVLAAIIAQIVRL